MKALVTGSSNLIGSEAVRLLDVLGKIESARRVEVETL